MKNGFFYLLNLAILLNFVHFVFLNRFKRTDKEDIEDDVLLLF